MADVIVIGGGGSGLAAAVEAGSDGARVVVLEKNTQLGGTTGIAVGSLTAACTSFQAAAGIQDSPSEHDEDMAKFAAEREQFNNAPLRRLLAEQAAETLEWLMGLGVEFVGPNPEPPNRVPRMHNVVPNAKAYIAALHRAALRYGVEIRVGCAAKRLIQDAQGRVVGMEAEDDAGRSLTFQATKGVVLAAGDYSNGYDIKRQFLPESIASIEGINPLCTGDGHRMGMEVGAALANMHLVFGPQIRFVQPPKPPFAQMLPTSPVLAKIMARTYDLLPRAVTRHIMKSLLVTWQHPEDTLFQKGAILVNREGRRFVDELRQPELVIPRQPGKEAFVLMDNRVAQVFSAFPNFISTAPDIAYAYLDDYRRLRQ
ncbi:MAG: FAD-dependent oxidoreductase, partial [Planctomycetes bacterium]|nr:FAD-dependent oxidoreductase [Planctomycetota bacterium]